MGLASAVVDFDLRVQKEEADDEYDIRLERRWKRRCIANKKFSSNSVKKTRNISVKMEDIPVDVNEPDEDYAVFLNDFLGNHHDGDNEADVNVRCSNDGHDDVEMEENDDQDAAPPDNMCLIDDDVPTDVDEHDEDYAVFLNCFVGNIDDDNDGDVSARCSDDCRDNVKNVKKDDQDADPQHAMCWDDDHDDPDPQYKMFLENLREDGQSYVLEVIINNGMSVLIKYEGEEGLSDGLKLDPQGTWKSWRREETETTRTLRSASKSEKIKSLNNLGNVLGIERTDKTGKTLRNVSRSEMTDSPHVLSGVSSIEKTEKTETARSASRREKANSPNILSSVSCLEKTETARLLRSNLQREKAERLNLLSNISSAEKTGRQRNLENISRKESMVTPETLRDVMGKENKNSMRDFKELFPSGTNGRICNMRESDMADENYQEFLNCLKNDGENFVYIPESGIPLKYEEDAESSDDSEIVATNKDPFCDGYFTPFVASKFDSIIDLDSKTSNGSPGSYSHSQFRKRLMEILRSPYDAKEYEDLLHEVSYRRPMERDRELRGVTKSYPLESVTKSYLDQHRDFARKINSIRCDRCRVLNLLRGFFFWLRNLVHEGAFQPWKDSSCLRVLPQM